MAAKAVPPTIDGRRFSPSPFLVYEPRTGISTLFGLTTAAPMSPRVTATALPGAVLLRLRDGSIMLLLVTEPGLTLPVASRPPCERSFAVLPHVDLDTWIWASVS